MTVILFTKDAAVQQAKLFLKIRLWPNDYPLR